MAFKAPRGTADILPVEQPYWQFVRQAAVSVAGRFAYRRIDTPAFEATSLFRRGVGEDTDIVQKEMYTFEDLGQDSITLRPEGTAPVCRAYIEHGMGSWPKPVKLYYIEPMFRYERPQAGRMRQFHQFGVEVFGDASPEIDVEVIELGWLFLKELGLENFTLQVNSIGDLQDRARYLEALKSYFSKHAAELPAVDRDRLDRSPMRLLDSKEPESQHLANNAPKMIDYLGESSAKRWRQTLDLLAALKSVHSDLNYDVNHRLVRGLDYYSHLVFEIEPAGARGQSTLVAGGRYDGLMEKLGGPPTPGIGFATGIERLVLNLQKQGASVPPGSEVQVVCIHIGDRARSRLMQVATALRARGVSAVSAPADRSIKAQMRYADTLAAKYALIVGEQELDRGNGTLKRLTTGEQVEVTLETEGLIAALN